MKIRVLGAGFYGCHLAAALIADGHDVVVHEVADHIFAGASGGIPARCHNGAHYPRSHKTREACRDHGESFMAAYGQFTRGVPVNLYAIAQDSSMVDFDQYVQTLRGEIEFITVHDPAEFGLQNVEGAILTGERHIITDDVRAHFEKVLDGHVEFNSKPELIDDPEYDMTIDCTFCANDNAAIDRYEPCVVLLLEGPTDKSVTVMDGPFASLYVYNENKGLCSLSSAKYTPFSKQCQTWGRAKSVLDGIKSCDIQRQTKLMLGNMAEFYPAIMDEYTVVDHRLSIRAMPKSGADSRLVDVVRVGERALRVRAGKIDAIIHAEQVIKQMMGLAQ
jgi:hypothetical protein